MDLSRFAGVDFLNPIATQAEAIFIKNTKKEAFSWDLFYSPLTPNSWLAMVAIAAFIALTVRGIKNYQQKMNDLSLAQELLFFIRCFVRTSGTYFGGTDLAKSDQVSSLRFVVFCVILSGNVVFISYQASLTSALSVIQSVRPFSSLQGLLDSEYR